MVCPLTGLTVLENVKRVTCIVSLQRIPCQKMYLHGTGQCIENVGLKGVMCFVSKQDIMCENVGVKAVMNLFLKRTLCEIMLGSRA